MTELNQVEHEQLLNPQRSTSGSSTCDDLPEAYEIVSVTSLENRSIGCQSVVTVQDAETQWEDPSLSDHIYFYSNINTKSSSMNSKCTQADMPSLSFQTLTSATSIFYTGLQLAVLSKLLLWFSTRVNTFPFQMNIGDQFLLVMMRLRLGLLYFDLGMRFKIFTTTAANIFYAWLPVMASQLKNLVFWLPRETIKNTLPSSFRTLFPKTTCIIDCTEVFINRPTSLRARSQTYSDYKSHNTLKFLVAIAPNGYIMFLSKCYGGRASDKFIVTECGFLSYILPGDEIMADRGFTVEEEVALKGATLNMPTFTKGKDQLSEVDVTETRRIASHRIFVECAIGRIKEFRILKHPLAFGERNADDIILICAALCNLKTPLIIS